MIITHFNELEDVDRTIGFLQNSYVVHVDISLTVFLSE